MMRALSIMDSSWLLMERRKTPMHIAGLSLFRLPEDRGASFLRELFDRHRNCGKLRGPFNQKLSLPGLGLPVLEDDPEMDIDYHVRHSALPANGSYRDLFVLVSRLHSTPLDLQRPLWEFHLIEGLPDRQYALYTKVHHSLADGTAGVRMMHGSLSPNPEETDMHAPWSRATDRIGRLDGEPRSAKPKASLRSVLRDSARLVPELARATQEMLGAATGLSPTAARTPWQAPRSILNGRLSGARRVVCQSWRVERLDRVAKPLGLTLNDVFLAMCAGALRAYLLSQNALPERPLICGVPVAIEREAGMGNSISVAYASLGTHFADPGARVRSIQTSIRAGRLILSGMSAPALLAYTLAVNVPLAIEQLAGMGGYAPPAFNLVISNVPGPKNPMYWNGARLEHVYPISLLPNGQALNITGMSYSGSLGVALIACRRTLPQMQRLIDYLEDALIELEGLVSTRMGRRRAG
jgi:WS/DGAT/MGAT family acyltransferase